MHDRQRWVRSAGSVLLVLACSAGAVLAAAQPSGRLEGPADPGEDVERGPITEGEQLRQWTALTDLELRAADPSFRLWVELIRAGLADKRIMRLWWFHRSRLDPFVSRVPEGWRQRGAAVLRDGARTARALGVYRPPVRGDAPRPPAGSIEATSERLRGGSPEGIVADAAPGISPWGVWVPIGPYNIPGRMTGLDRPEGEPLTLYAAAADGGAWRTRDGGASWEVLTELEATQSGGSILLDPSNPSVIYFGTGEGNGAIDNYGGIGVLKSTDAGRTWTASNPFSGSVRRLAMHRSEPSRVYAAGDSGCYLSTDAGATFTLISGAGLPTNAGASDVLVRPDDANTVFCAIWGGSQGGIYRSVDHGASWSFLSSGLPAMGSVGRIALAVSRSNPDVMIAGIDTASGTVYKTTDGGDTWTALAGGSAGFCGGQCWYDIAVGIDPVDPGVLYAGGVGHRRSMDGGLTWGPADSGVHVDHHFVFTPAAGEVILANDGGVYRSGDHGASWSNWSLGMDTSQYYGMCRHPSDPDWAFGGTQDNGSHRRRLTDTPAWQQRLGGDGGMCMSGPPSGSVVLGEYQNLNIQRSTDGGNSFFGANGGIPSREPHPWVGLLVADPSDRNNMWTATNRIYRSLDARATNWVVVSGALYFNLSATAIEVAPADGNVVYAGFDAGGVFVSSNALAAAPTWTSIKGSLANRGVRRIRSAPWSADVVYLVHAGYGAGKIWKSTNRGGSWTNVTGDLPDVPVNDLVVDGDAPGTLIAATDLGVFRSDDDGASWYGWSTGLPTVASIEMSYDAASGKLRLGTHGRSMWDWQEASATPVAVPDGAVVPGRQMTLERIGAADVRVRWDVRGCTARDYNLFWGDLDDVAIGTYAGATCGLGTSGMATVPMPTTSSGNVFFVVASSDAAGTEGPHGHAGDGTPSARNGIGLCGIAAQEGAATCP